ncbi:peroxiredoxin family protein [Niabella ginsengisoli]|uniref:TlpA family protein disulfide reductase n=1 Tax=Niabella ginsengisoli TaxID=522298 RepID=A0ABS9SLP2_9BACT|nr:TlpA disulfide reductase family protein [Niabella ginsengisoli]MCH5599196.1 TlpA family protein disulfide reductase [Niabella ginsengisoli]
MKRILLYLCVCLPLAVLGQTKNAAINGSLKNISANIPNIYFTYRSGDEMIRDSVKVADNSYVINIEEEMPLMITLLSVDPQGEIRPVKKDVAQVYLQAGTNTIISTDSFSNVQVKESKAHAEYVKLKTASEFFNNQMRELGSKYPALKANNDTAGIKKLEADYEALNNKMQEDVYGAYVKQNNHSPIALYALSQYAGYDIDPVKIEPLFNALPATAKESGAGKRFAKKLAIAKATAIGAMAPEFSQADTTGKQVSLASFKGKYVLVDFWASWCGPCRAENPNVVAAFNKYKNKNFTVLGVSLDDAEDDGKVSWLKAIAKDQLTWTQVSDLKGWQNSVAQQYGIQAIPQNLLLDPTGKIIAKNVRGEELHQKLEELIK